MPNSTISSQGSTTFCQGDSVILNVIAVTGSTYQWQLNGSSISGTNSNSFTALDNGSYTVVVTNSFGCSSTSSTPMTVVVHSLPIVTLNSFEDVCDNQGLLQLISGNPIGGNYSGTSVTNDQFNTSIGLGSYLISYTYSDDNGCSATASNSIQVIHCSGASLDELTEFEIKVYPNPTSEYSIIEIPSNLIGSQLELIDNSGRIIIRKELISTENLIELNKVSTGVYSFRICGNSLTKQLMKF